eukprot:gene746-467_t
MATEEIQAGAERAPASVGSGQLAHSFYDLVLFPCARMSALPMLALMLFRDKEREISATTQFFGLPDLIPENPVKPFFSDFLTRVGNNKSRVLVVGLQLLPETLKILESFATVDFVTRDEAKLISDMPSNAFDNRFEKWLPTEEFSKISVVEKCLMHFNPLLGYKNTFNNTDDAMARLQKQKESLNRWVDDVVVKRAPYIPLCIEHSHRHNVPFASWSEDLEKLALGFHVQSDEVFLGGFGFVSLRDEDNVKLQRCPTDCLSRDMAIVGQQNENFFESAIEKGEALLLRLELTVRELLHLGDIKLGPAPLNYLRTHRFENCKTKKIKEGLLCAYCQISTLSGPMARIIMRALPCVDLVVTHSTSYRKEDPVLHVKFRARGDPVDCRDLIKLHEEEYGDFSDRGWAGGGKLYAGGLDICSADMFEYKEKVLWRDDLRDIQIGDVAREFRVWNFDSVIPGCQELGIYTMLETERLPEEETEQHEDGVFSEDGRSGSSSSSEKIAKDGSESVVIVTSEEKEVFDPPSRAENMNSGVASSDIPSSNGKVGGAVVQNEQTNVSSDSFVKVENEGSVKQVQEEIAKTVQVEEEMDEDSKIEEVRLLEQENAEKVEREERERLAREAEEEQQAKLKRRREAEEKQEADEAERQRIADLEKQRIIEEKAKLAAEETEKRKREEQERTRKRQLEEDEQNLREQKEAQKRQEELERELQEQKERERVEKQQQVHQETNPLDKSKIAQEQTLENLEKIVFKNFPDDEKRLKRIRGINPSLYRKELQDRYDPRESVEQASCGADVEQEPAQPVPPRKPETNSKSDDTESIRTGQKNVVPEPRDKKALAKELMGQLAKYIEDEIVDPKFEQNILQFPQEVFGMRPSCYKSVGDDSDSSGDGDRGERSSSPSFNFRYEQFVESELEKRYQHLPLPTSSDFECALDKMQRRPLHGKRGNLLKFWQKGEDKFKWKSGCLLVSMEKISNDDGFFVRRGQLLILLGKSADSLNVSWCGVDAVEEKKKIHTRRVGVVQSTKVRLVLIILRPTPGFEVGEPVVVDDNNDQGKKIDYGLVLLKVFKVGDLLKPGLGDDQKVLLPIHCFLPLDEQKARKNYPF